LEKKLPTKQNSGDGMEIHGGSGIGPGNYVGGHGDGDKMTRMGKGWNDSTEFAGRGRLGWG